MCPVTISVDVLPVVVNADCHPVLQLSTIQSSKWLNYTILTYPPDIFNNDRLSLIDYIFAIIFSDGNWSETQSCAGVKTLDWWTVLSETQVKEDGLWCQVLPEDNMGMGDNIGDWYYPSGDTPEWWLFSGPNQWSQ